MAEPILTFGCNHDAAGDTPWGYDGVGNNPDINGWKGITPATDLVVFTGGGIDDPDEANGGANAMGSTTLSSGVRSATIRPSTTYYTIPYTYIEKADGFMYYAQFTGKTAYRYAMAVHIYDHMTSDLYLEAWDDNSFSTTALEILTGTANSSSQSFVNAIRTTGAAPPWNDTGSPPIGWNGSDTGAAYLRGQEHRVALGNATTLTNETVYYNIYIQLETDCSTFYVTPVLAFRYLYT